MSLLVLGFGPGAYGDTIWVPDQVSTIQAGIEAASAGDVVMVADGTYTGAHNRDLDFDGKAITVRSVNGPGSAIIDCEGNGQGFIFHDGEAADAVVDGFTITGGDGDYGGGIYCSGSSPTITNCIITDNDADYDGGGAYCYDSEATFTNCTFSSNIAIETPPFDAKGGAIRCDGTTSDLTITNCTFTSNESYSSGGAAYFDGSDATITHCTFSDNFASWGWGGAVHCVGEPSELTITNCLFIGNWCYLGGTVHCCTYAHANIFNCTIADNEADASAGAPGGVQTDICARATLCDSILWDNSPYELTPGLYITATYCDIEFADPNEVKTGTGNINEDPVFATGPGALGCYYLSQEEAGDEGQSPCVDVGSDTAENLDLDDRTTRTDEVEDSETVDMGYHYPT